MIDQSKRNTIKNVAVIGAGTAAVAASPGLLALDMVSAKTSASHLAELVDEPLIDIQITTRLSTISNDLEVVITNTSASTATITDMTPAVIHTVRGRFDFNALLEAGDLRLAAGESVTVPIRHHTVVLDASSVHDRAKDLTQGLRRNVSIITDGNSFAATTVKELVNFA